MKVNKKESGDGAGEGGDGGERNRSLLLLK